MGFPATVVLGASGRIGSLLRHCWPQFPAVGGTSSDMPVTWQLRRPVPRLCANEKQVLLDPLADPDGLCDLLQDAEVVLCLAGSIPGRSGALADNCRLACATIKAAATVAARTGKRTGRSAARVLLASSAAVYGAQSGRLREDSPCLANQAYGRAKTDMEEQALGLGQALGVPVCALRIGNIAGLDAILGGWRAGFCLDQLADGRSPRRSYIGVQHLAQLLAALVATPGLPARLNLAQPEPVEMAALLRAAKRDFSWRPASDAVIAKVDLDLSALRRHLAQHPDADALLRPAEPAELVAQWASLEPHMTQILPPPKQPKETPRT